MHQPSNSGRTATVTFLRYVFDVSLIRTATTLAMGGCVYVPREDERFNILEEAVGRMLVNWAFFTLSLARSLTLANMMALQTVFIAGEAVGRDDERRWS
ncbi:hypothetical protein LTR37_008969 [Vermiconidia calcicola]|uniref:Uncharacterized protein n=1 Tax=Vermiconidia calcicola TaxID=1690605 RepID=A0ACC3N956_9PEZI|nr:hypothetical protein LTR37_008969 [Vermiconidia calcicola]